VNSLMGAWGKIDLLVTRVVLRKPRYWGDVGEVGRGRFLGRAVFV